MGILFLEIKILNLPLTKPRRLVKTKVIMAHGFIQASWMWAKPSMRIKTKSPAASPMATMLGGLFGNATVTMVDPKTMKKTISISQRQSRQKPRVLTSKMDSRNPFNPAHREKLGRQISSYINYVPFRDRSLIMWSGGTTWYGGGGGIQVLIERGGGGGRGVFCAVFAGQYLISLQMQ